MNKLRLYYIRQNKSGGHTQVLQHILKYVLSQMRNLDGWIHRSRKQNESLQELVCGRKEGMMFWFPFLEILWETLWQREIVEAVFHLPGHILPSREARTGTQGKNLKVVFIPHSVTSNQGTQLQPKVHSKNHEECCLLASIGSASVFLQFRTRYLENDTTSTSTSTSKQDHPHRHVHRTNLLKQVLKDASHLRKV